MNSTQPILGFAFFGMGAAFESYVRYSSSKEVRELKNVGIGMMIAGGSLLVASFFFNASEFFDTQKALKYLPKEGEFGNLVQIFQKVIGVNQENCMRNVYSAFVHQPAIWGYAKTASGQYIYEIAVRVKCCIAQNKCFPAVIGFFGSSLKNGTSDTKNVIVQLYTEYEQQIEGPLVKMIPTIKKLFEQLLTGNEITQACCDFPSVVLN